jgi:psp operon transcriptional activator
MSEVLVSTPPGEALGQSEAFLAFGEALSQVAKVERPVLILGERGTGKELAASRLHYLSPRWGEPLVALDCAALTPSLIEAELFGHEAGAFTGAGSRRLGRFESAHNGTLFLDEIGNIPLTVQEKILRVVEYGSFERVGGSRPVQVDARIVGATNADLQALVRAGRFKQDLLDRLSFEVLTLPPLRARGDDVLLLARHFAARMAAELGWPQAPDFSPAAEQALMDHPWPGNVRELKNVVERSVYRCQGRVLERLEFDPFVSPYAPAQPADALATEAASPPAADVPFKQAVARFERKLLRDALERSRFNQKQAAQRLGLSYHQLRGLLKKYGGMEQLA